MRDRTDVSIQIESQDKEDSRIRCENNRTKGKKKLGTKKTKRKVAESVRKEEMRLGKVKQIQRKEKRGRKIDGKIGEYRLKLKLGKIN